MTQLGWKQQWRDGVVNKTGLLLLAALAAVMFLAACGPANDAPAAPETGAQADAPAEEAPAPPTEVPATEAPTVAPAEEAAPTAPPAEEAPAAPSQVIGILRVGVNAEFRPFVFNDENGNLAGFDIDLMNALSSAGNFEMTYQKLPFDQLFTALENDEIDVAISAITVTDDRRTRVDFTDPYFTTGQAPVSYFSAGQGLAVRTDNNIINSIADLTADMKVGVKRSTTGEEFVRTQTPAQIVTYPESVPALEGLRAGEVAAVVLDISVMTDYIRTNPDSQLKLVGGPVNSEEYAIAVAKERPVVLDGLNMLLAQLREDGTYDRIFNRWFGTP